MIVCSCVSLLVRACVFGVDGGRGCVRGRGGGGGGGQCINVPGS